MSTKIDVRRLGMLMRTKREKKQLTLKEVADQTGLKVPTLSRIERGASQDVEGATLMTLSKWLGSKPEDFWDSGISIGTATSQTIHSTPDNVELYLRADKNLDPATAAALSTLFRTAYETMSKRIRSKRG